MKVIKVARQPKPKWYRAEPKPTNVGRTQFSDKQKFANEMRENPTPTEKLMGDLLTEHGIKFQSQVVILGYIADFYFRHAKSVVEVDGLVHRSQKKYDAHRDEAFREKGFRVLRIPSARLLKDPLGVVTEIKAYLLNGGRKKRQERNIRRKANSPNPKRWQDVPRLTKEHLPIK